MAASPETDALLLIGDTYSSPPPPSSPVLPLAQVNSSLTTAAPPEQAQLDHTVHDIPTSPPPPEQDTAENPDLGESLPPADGGDLAPSLPPPEAAPAAYSALEAASPEKSASPPSSPPRAPIEVFPDASASAASPPPSPQIGDAPPPSSPPPTPPDTTSPRAVLESYTTDAVAMAFREAASLPPVSELDPHSAPAPLRAPLKGGPERLSLQQHPEPAAPAMTPQACENLKPAQPPPLSAESTYMLLDASADEVAPVASAEAAGSTLALEAMDVERDTAPDMPPALESGAEGELLQQPPHSPSSEIMPQLCQNSEPAKINLSEVPLQEPMQTSSSPKMEAEACSPDMAPPGFENFKSKWLPQPAHTLPVESTHYMESGAAGELPQQLPQLPSSEIVPPLCQNLEPAKMPQLPHPPAESTCCSLEAAVNEVAAVASEKAAGSPPTLDAKGGKVALESRSEVPLQEQMQTSSPPNMEAEACSPDMAPPGFENFKSKWLPQPAHTLPVESTHYMEGGAAGELPQQLPQSPSSEIVPPLCQNLEPAKMLQLPPPPAESTCCSLEAALNEVAAVASEKAAGSPPTLVATSGEVALESRSEVPLQEPMQTSSPTNMEAEACSPDMAPPGFENFKSKWLPQPAHTLPVESTHYMVEALATDTTGMMLEAVAGSMPALEAMDVEMDISAGQLSSSKSAKNVPLRQSLMVPSSLTIEAAPCSPDTPPPGFENFKTSWLPQPTVPPSAETSYLPDVANTKEELVENSCSVPALDTMDMETDTTRNLLPMLDSGAGGPLELSDQSSPSPKIQPAPCSPYITPPGFESFTLPQLQLPSPVAQTSHISQASAATGGVSLTSEDVPQTSPVLKAMDVERDAAPALQTSSKSGTWESMQQELSGLPSCCVKGITCSLEIVSSGSENFVSLEDAVNTTVTVEAVGHPQSVAEATEEAKGHVLPSQLENGCDGPLPCLEPKVSSPVAQAVPSSPGITPTGFEGLVSSQQTSLRLAETIDSPSHLPFTKSVTVKLEKTGQPLSPLQATYTDMESARVLQSPLKSEEKSLPHPQHQPSSPYEKDTPCSPDIAAPEYENLDSSEELPPPPPLCPYFEIGQMVCGCCRELVAYPRGATHVQCFGCWTINLVLEEHQVGKVYCGQCETLLMYPFGAPAVRCSNCLFVTEIGERNVRMSAEKGTPPPPQPQELGQA